jgi:tetratricopeptide (TPR) repeat protein/pSer/pThr/pTyr-binding forkhead associated (FHA) protein
VGLYALEKHMDRTKLQPRLVIIEGKDKGKAISLRHGTSILGRSKADVIIEDPRISRSHIAMHFDEKIGNVSFTDLKSLNGTLLNGQSAESGELKDGDKLQLGNTLFDFQLRPDAWETSLSISIRPPEPSAPPGEPLASISRGPAIELERDKRPEPVLAQRADSRGNRDLATSQESESNRPTRLGKDTQSIDEDSEDLDLAHELSQLQKIRQIYLKLPRRARLWIWVGLMVGFVFWGGTSKSPTAESSFAQLEALEKSAKADEALALAEKLLTEQRLDGPTQKQLGAYFEKQGRFDAAITAYTNAANAKPQQTVATVRLVSLLLRSGKLEAADKAMEKLDGLLRDGPHSKELFIEAAQLFIENKEIKQAPEKALILAKALQNEFAPDSSIGYKLEAQVHFREKRNEEALAVVEKGLRLAPRDEWLLENLAFAKLSLRDLPGAETVVRNWLENSPNNAKAQLVMAYLRFNEKDYEGALPYTQSILQTKQNAPEDPYYQEALFLTGQIYFNQGQTAEAGAFMRRACEVGYEPGCRHEAVGGPSDRNTATPSERAPADPGVAVPPVQPPPGEAIEPTTGAGSNTGTGIPSTPSGDVAD